MRTCLIIILMSIFSNTYCQVEINQLDSLNRKQGVWLFQNKDTLMIYNYENGLKNGSYTKIIEGIIRETGTYRNDTLQGWLYGFYSNGVIHYMRHFKNGKKDGIHTWFYEDGISLAFTQYWKDDYPVDCNTMFDYDGSITSEFCYTDGINKVGKFIHYYNDGSYIVSNIVNGKKEGEEILYDIDGNEIKITIYKDGKIIEIIDK